MGLAGASGGRYSALKWAIGSGLKLLAEILGLEERRISALT